MSPVISTRQTDGSANTVARPNRYWKALLWTSAACAVGTMTPAIALQTGQSGDNEVEQPTDINTLPPGDFDVRSALQRDFGLIPPQDLRLPEGFDPTDYRLLRVPILSEELDRESAIDSLSESESTVGADQQTDSTTAAAMARGEGVLSLVNGINAAIDPPTTPPLSDSERDRLAALSDALNAIDRRLAQIDGFENQVENDRQAREDELAGLPPPTAQEEFFNSNLGGFFFFSGFSINREGSENFGVDRIFAQSNATDDSSFEAFAGTRMTMFGIAVERGLIDPEAPEAEQRERFRELIRRFVVREGIVVEDAGLTTPQGREGIFFREIAAERMRLARLLREFALLHARRDRNQIDDGAFPSLLARTGNDGNPALTDGTAAVTFDGSDGGEIADQFGPFILVDQKIDQVTARSGFNPFDTGEIESLRNAIDSAALNGEPPPPPPPAGPAPTPPPGNPPPPPPPAPTTPLINNFNQTISCPTGNAQLFLSVFETGGQVIFDIDEAVRGFTDVTSEILTEAVQSFTFTNLELPESGVTVDSLTVEVDRVAGTFNISNFSCSAPAFQALTASATGSFCPVPDRDLVIAARLEQDGDGEIALFINSDGNGTSAPSAEFRGSGGTPFSIFDEPIPVGPGTTTNAGNGTVTDLSMSMTVDFGAVLVQPDPPSNGVARLEIGNVSCSVTRE